MRSAQAVDVCGPSSIPIKLFGIIKMDKKKESRRSRVGVSPVVRSTVHTVHAKKGRSRARERAVRAKDTPRLPDLLREENILGYDEAQFPFRASVAAMLARTGEEIGSFDTSECNSLQLEQFKIQGAGDLAKHRIFATELASSADFLELYMGFGP